MCPQQVKPVFGVSCIQQTMGRSPDNDDVYHPILTSQLLSSQVTELTQPMRGEAKAICIPNQEHFSSIPRVLKIL